MKMSTKRTSGTTTSAPRAEVPIVTISKEVGSELRGSEMGLIEERGGGNATHGATVVCRLLLEPASFDNKYDESSLRPSNSRGKCNRLMDVRLGLLI